NPTNRPLPAPVNPLDGHRSVKAQTGDLCGVECEGVVEHGAAWWAVSEVMEVLGPGSANRPLRRVFAADKAFGLRGREDVHTADEDGAGGWRAARVSGRGRPAPGTVIHYLQRDALRRAYIELRERGRVDV